MRRTTDPLRYRVRRARADAKKVEQSNSQSGAGADATAPAVPPPPAPPVEPRMEPEPGNASEIPENSGIKTDAILPGLEENVPKIMGARRSSGLDIFLRRKDS